MKKSISITLTLAFLANQASALTLAELKVCAKADVPKVTAATNVRQMMSVSLELASLVVAAVGSKSNHPDEKKLRKFAELSMSCQELETYQRKYAIQVIDEIKNSKSSSSLDETILMVLFESKAQFDKRKAELQKNLAASGYTNVAATLTHEHSLTIAAATFSPLSMLLGGKRSGPLDSIEPQLTGDIYLADETAFQENLKLYGEQKSLEMSDANKSILLAQLAERRATVTASQVEAIFFNEQKNELLKQVQEILK